MQKKQVDNALLALAGAAAELLAPAIVKAVDMIVDAKLAQARPVQPPVVRNGVRHHKNGVAKNGHLTPAQQRTLTEMGTFNKGNGGSVFMLPSSSKKAPHAVVRVANNLERYGMIKMEDGEQFVLTAKGKLQADHK